MFFPMWRRLTGHTETKTKNLYSTSDAQVHDLALLVKQPGWAVYMHLLDKHTATLAEELLFGDFDALLETRGVIKGYREAALLVVNILQEKEQRDARSAAERRSESERLERRATATKFSPFASGTR